MNLEYYQRSLFYIELPSPKGVGFIIHRNELNGLLESYSFSIRLTSRSPYGSMIMDYWLSNFPSILNIEFFLYLKKECDIDQCFFYHFITKFILKEIWFFFCLNDKN
ncbi:MAG: hypothetical protein KGD63_02195 [Candidatus Lokiarchaeota archaeon]|nr:hypothetical protein [Candidatus Lokiarchaeota archaeon]